jgi:ribose 1,5-bisphosphokinase
VSPEASTPPGSLVLVVGPSGAGKDTLLRLACERLAGRPDIVFARRLVTRPSGPFEDHDTIDDAAFEQGRAEGRFPLAWRAHGLGYALPPSMRSVMDRGSTVVVNVSRAVVEEARARFAQVGVVLVTAPVEELSRRVALRGRDPDVAARVNREAPDARDLEPDIVIENVGDPAVGAGRLAAFIAGINGPAGRTRRTPPRPHCA